jgi:hypothetical protein
VPQPAANPSTVTSSQHVDFTGVSVPTPSSPSQGLSSRGETSEPPAVR